MDSYFLLNLLSAALSYLQKLNWYSLKALQIYESVGINNNNDYPPSLSDSSQGNGKQLCWPKREGDNLR